MPGEQCSGCGEKVLGAGKNLVASWMPQINFNVMVRPITWTAKLGQSACADSRSNVDAHSVEQEKEEESAHCIASCESHLHFGQVRFVVST